MNLNDKVFKPQELTISLPELLFRWSKALKKENHQIAEDLFTFAALFGKMDRDEDLKRIIGMSIFLGAFAQINNLFKPVSKKGPSIVGYPSIVG